VAARLAVSSVVVVVVVEEGKEGREGWKEGGMATRRPNPLPVPKGRGVLLLPEVLLQQMPPPSRPPSLPSWVVVNEAEKE